MFKTSERLAEWVRIKSGEAKIVVGRERSFAPASDIGCNYTDEERMNSFIPDHN